MKKSTLILAGAIAFDLGVMVVSSHAAVDTFLKIEIFQDGKRIGVVDNADACKVKGGKVVMAGAIPQCQLPTKNAGAGANKCTARSANGGTPGPTKGGTPAQDDCNSVLQGVSTTR
jgi:hypothetical protein